MGVNPGGRGDDRVAEPLLDQLDVTHHLQQASCAGMAEAMDHAVGVSDPRVLPGVLPSPLSPCLGQDGEGAILDVLAPLQGVCGLWELGHQCDIRTA